MLICLKSSFSPKENTGTKLALAGQKGRTQVLGTEENVALLMYVSVCAAVTAGTHPCACLEVERKCPSLRAGAKSVCRMPGLLYGGWGQNSSLQNCTVQSLIRSLNLPNPKVVNLNNLLSSRLFKKTSQILKVPVLMNLHCQST